jgi:hypothetical protein
VITYKNNVPSYDLTESDSIHFGLLIRDNMQYRRAFLIRDRARRVSKLNSKKG